MTQAKNDATKPGALREKVLINEQKMKEESKTSIYKQSLRCYRIGHHNTCQRLDIPP